MEHWAADDPLHASVGKSDPYQWLAGQRGETLREKAGRRTFRFTSNGTSYFAKLSRGVGLREALKELSSLRTPPLDSEREARALERLDESNVPAPRLVGWGRRGWFLLHRRSFVITQDVGTQRTLEDVAKTISPEAFLERRRWIERVARLAAAMHDAGVNHRDLYFGHILVQGDVEAPELVLIDLHRAQVWKKIPERWLAKDLGALGFAAIDHGLTRTDRARFVKHYAGATFASTVRARRSLWKRAAKRIVRIEAERQRKGANFGG